MLFTYILLIGLAALSAHTWVFNGSGSKQVPQQMFQEKQTVTLAASSWSDNLALDLPNLTDGKGYTRTNGSIDASYSYRGFSVSVGSLESLMPHHNDDRVDIKGTYYGRAYAVEAQYHRVPGFTYGGTPGTGPEWGAYDWRSDLEVISYGFNVTYAFLPDQFSPQAVYGYESRPLAWGWSPLVMLSQDSFSITASAPLLSTADAGPYGASKQFSGGLFTTTAASAGFGVFYPLGRFFGEYTLLGGRGIELRRFNVGVGSDVADSSTTAQKAYMHIATGYFGDNFVMGLNVTYDSKWTFLDGMALQYENNLVSAFSTWRF